VTDPDELDDVTPAGRPGKPSAEVLHNRVRQAAADRADEERYEQTINPGKERAEPLTLRPR